jgi:hypothetical protein
VQAELLAFCEVCGTKGEPTSGLEPLTLVQYRVINHVLQRLAQGCNSRIHKPIFFLRLAQCCTVIAFPVVSEWCQGPAHCGDNLGAEQLDGAHHLVVRNRADADLRHKALVAEKLVLEEDLLRNLLRASDQERAA